MRTAAVAAWFCLVIPGAIILTGWGLYALLSLWVRP